MDPAEVIALAITAAHDAPPPGEPDRFPGTYETAEVILERLRLSGLSVVPISEGLEAIISRLESRNKGVPSYSSIYDGDAQKAAEFIRSALNF
jgi:hypothetical protein